MSGDVHPDFIPILIERLVQEERLKRETFRDKWGLTPQHVSPIFENIEEAMSNYQSWKATQEKLCYYVETNNGCSALGVSPSGDGGPKY